MAKQKRSSYLLIVLAGIIIVALLFWFINNLGPPAENDPYSETFSEAGSWIIGDDASAQGQIKDGAYELFVELSGDIFWVTAGRTFANATYELEARPVEGTPDNGYGMVFRVDNEKNDFYIFKISSDGYVYIGVCQDSCAESTALVDRDWFASPAINQGFGKTNRLRVVADGPRMTYFINDTEVGQVIDDTLKKGDIGLIVETFAPGGLRVAFDNFNVTPK